MKIRWFASKWSLLRSQTDSKLHFINTSARKGGPGGLGRCLVFLVPRVFVSGHPLFAVIIIATIAHFIHFQNCSMLNLNLTVSKDLKPWVFLSQTFLKFFVWPFQKFDSWNIFVLLRMFCFIVFVCFLEYFERVVRVQKVKWYFVIFQDVLSGWRQSWWLETKIKW